MYWTALRMVATWNLTCRRVQRVQRGEAGVPRAGEGVAEELGASADGVGEWHLVLRVDLAVRAEPLHQLTT
jgi:hypothetical protein